MFYALKEMVSVVVDLRFTTKTVKLCFVYVVEYIILLGFDAAYLNNNGCCFEVKNKK